MKREPMVVAIESKGICRDFNEDTVLAAFKKGRKILILDFEEKFGGDFKFKENGERIKAIYVSAVIRFSKQTRPEIRRIRPYMDDGRRMTAQEMIDTTLYVLNIFSDGLIFMEGFEV